MDEAQFRRQLREQGYSEAEVREYEPNTAKDMHAHESSVYAFVSSGEFTLVTEDGSVSYQPGEVCKVPSGTLHSEQAGAAGATVLLGKK